MVPKDPSVYGEPSSRSELAPPCRIFPACHSALPAASSGCFSNTRAYVGLWLPRPQQLISTTYYQGDGTHQPFGSLWPPLPRHYVA